MSIQIAPQLETELQNAAMREGLSTDQIVTRILVEWLEDQEDVAVAKHRLANPINDEPYPTLDDLRHHLER